MITLTAHTPDDHKTNHLQAKAPSSRRIPRGLSQNSADASVNSVTIWVQQLLTVDFRHAFWPWLGYMSALAMLCYGAAKWGRESHPHYVWNSWALVTVGLVAPAVAVRIFCTDFDQGTAARLLASPVKRGSIWLARLGLTVALLLAPAALTYFLVPGMSWLYLIGEGVGQRPFTMGGVYLAWCAWSFGPMFSVLFRRSILAWSATVIMPFIVAVWAAILSPVTGSDPGSPDLFPYLPKQVLVTGLALGVVSQFFAAWYWRRMEVRS
jgi:hypothetical protein